MIVNCGVKPNKEVGPNLVNWANNGPCIKTFKVMDLELGLGPIKENGNDGLSGPLAKIVMLCNDLVLCDSSGFPVR